MKSTNPEPRVIGQTRDVGFEIGVRKTLEAPPQLVWQVLTSKAGLHAWLGDIAQLPEEKRAAYGTQDGTEGEIRAINLGSHVRLTWKPKDWPTASILQVRVLPSGGKTVLSFHQERLPNGEVREQMRKHWKEVIQKLEQLL